MRQRSRSRAAVILGLGVGWGVIGCQGALPGDGPSAPFRSGVLIDAPVDAVALGSDDSGIYWTSGANELWVLRTGATMPECLAAGPPPPATCNQATAPVLASTQVFWAPADRASIHRTRKDGGGDEIVAQTTRAEIAIDTDDVYWTDVTGPFGEGSGVVLSLPLDAAPGSTPAKRVQVSSSDEVTAIAVFDGALYWSDTEVVGTTVDYADLGWGPLTSLDGIWHGRAVNLPGNSRRLDVAGGNVYAASEDGMYVTSLVRLSSTGEAQTIGTLPGQRGTQNVVVLGNWALVSVVSTDDCPQPTSLDLAAIPVGGGDPRPVVTGMHTAAVAMGPGIVFVDASNRLVAMSPSDVDQAIMGPDQP